MYMNLKANKHKRISFNTTARTSLGFIVPPPPLKLYIPLKCSSPSNLFFCSGPSAPPPLPNYFGLKILGPP